MSVAAAPEVRSADRYTVHSMLQIVVLTSHGLQLSCSEVVHRGKW